MWGGHDLFGPRADGGRYDAATDTWRPTAMEGAPTPRTGASGVWAGSAVSGVSIDPDLVTLSWEPATAIHGGPLLYDVVRGLVSELPAGSGPSGVCLETGSADAFTTDLDTPPPGGGFWYLVRVREHCAGSYGSASDGTPRSTSSCGA